MVLGSKEQKSSLGAHEELGELREGIGRVRIQDEWMRLAGRLAEWQFRQVPSERCHQDDVVRNYF